MTSLTRFTPTSNLDPIQRQFDSLFQNFFTAPRTSGNTAWMPRVDIHEDENAYVLHMDAPGLNKEDFQIDFSEGTLSISGQRKATERTENDTVVHVERRYGSFYRSFTLPKLVDVDGVQARYENGVLTIVVPKAEESKPRRITVG